MATRKRIAVKICTYTGRDGQTKNRYKNIGEIVTKDDGGTFVTIDASIVSMQLFALANTDRQERLVCSVFADEDAPQAKPATGGDGGIADMTDDIPF